jgi:hypothetical protein
MATNRKLRAELLSRLGCSPQALSKRAKVIKKNHGPMSTEDAVYLIAHKKGIDLSKYLEKSIVDGVRNLVPQEGQGRETQLRTRNAGERTILIKIDTNIPAVDAMLSTSLADDMKKMAQLYPLQYLLENSLRVVIKRVLEKKHGPGWWEGKVNKRTKDDVTDRKLKEAKQPWHGKRGQHEIYYSDFTDLKKIIFKNWDDFKDIFPSQPWIFQKLDELEHPRNVIAHNNPLGKDDTKRIELYFSDWMNLLKQKRDLIQNPR